MYLQVWEAVGELNSRSSLGRAVVNPPERKSETKPRLTNDAWYLCKCGRAFSNVKQYDDHRAQHQVVNFAETWIYSENTKKSKELKNGVDHNSSRRKASHNRSSVFEQSHTIKPNERINSSSTVKKCVDKKRISTNSTNKKHGDAVRVENSNGIKCNKCGRDFQRLGHLRVHLRHKHANRINLEPLTSAPLSCKMCPMTFKSQNGYMQHRKRVHGEEATHACSRCSMKYYSAFQLHIHFKRHKRSRTSRHKKVKVVKLTTSKSSIILKSSPPELMSSVSELKSSSQEVKSLSQELKSSTPELKISDPIANENHPRIEKRTKRRREIYPEEKVPQITVSKKRREVKSKDEKDVKSTKNERDIKSPTNDRKEVNSTKDERDVKSPTKGRKEVKSIKDGLTEIFYDAIGTRTRSKNNATPPPESSTLEPEEKKQIDLKTADPSEITTDTDNCGDQITLGQPTLFDCEKCGLPFKTARGLSQHDKWYHTQMEVEITCKICPAKFTTETDLQKHMVNHSIKLMYKKFKFGHIITSTGPTVSERTRSITVKQEQPPSLPGKTCPPVVTIPKNEYDKPLKINVGHVEDKGDKCGYCGQLFFDRTILWPHLKECRGTLV